MPEASPKGKGKKEDKPASPYTPKKMKLTTQCFKDAKLLERQNLCIFKGEFHTPEGRKVLLVNLPDTFQQLGHDDNLQEIYAKLGINGYFKLKPWGIDIQRAYEVITSIDDIGTVALTGEDG